MIRVPSKMTFEDELTALKADVAVIRSNYMTRSDLQEVRRELKGEIQSVRTEPLKEMLGMRAELHKVLHAQALRMYGFGALLVTVVHFVTRAGY